MLVISIGCAEKNRTIADDLIHSFCHETTNLDLRTSLRSESVIASAPRGLKSRF